MELMFCKVLMLLGITGPQHESMFTRRHCPETHKRIRVHLEGDEHLLVPKHARVKYILPTGSIEVPEDKKLIFPKPIIILNNKKPILLNQNEFEHYELGGGGPPFPLGSKDMAFSDMKTYYQKNNHMSLGEELWRPPVPIENIEFNSVSTLPPSALLHHQQQYHHMDPHQHHQFDDGVKPVMEDTEDDLKYDFRTKAHSHSESG